ncbi:MAG: rhomboid family intramembrane serine protease [Deferribacterales bacterium]
MFPLKDSIPSSRFPYVNWAIILLNIFIFARMLNMPEQAENNMIFQLGLIPKRVFVESGLLTFSDRVIPFFTSMFMHGGFMHIIGNMYFLYIFGDNVEDRLGHGKYLIMYILFGLAAACSQVVLFPDSIVPMIGASGAVAGVMGAYMVFYPKARVKTLVIIIIFITIVDIPAVFFLLLWFFMQFINGAGAGHGGVAWWAHIGGFIAGLLYAVTQVRNRNIEDYQII